MREVKFRKIQNQTLHYKVMKKAIHKGLFTNDVSSFWGLWHPLVLMSAYHQLLACPLVLQIDDVSPEPKMIIFGWSLKMPINHPLAPKGVQLSLVRLTRAFFGWIPSNRWIFHHSSSFLMTLSPSSSSFVIFLSYCWLLNMLRRHLWTAPYWWNEWPKISITLIY